MALAIGRATDLGTFLRGSDATYFDSAGILRTAGPNVLRLDHDPATGKALGARLEGVATNRITRNQSFVAPWAFNAPASRTGGIDDPAGGNNATRFSGLGNMYAAGINWGVGASARVEPSAFVRRVTASGILLMASRHGSGYGRFEIDLAALGPGWRRITRNTPGVTVVNEHITNPAGTWSPSFSNSSGDTEIVVDVWCAQGDLGTLPTSPIPTDASAVTRLPDSLSIDRAGTPEGTVVVEAVSPPGDSGVTGNDVNGLFEWNDGSGSNRISVYRRASNRMYMELNVGSPVSVITAPMSPTPVGNATRFRAALSWKEGQLAASLNGEAAAVATGYAGPMPTTSKIYIGCRRANNPAYAWFGTIARLAIFDRAYTPSQLQEISA